MAQAVTMSSAKPILLEAVARARPRGVLASGAGSDIAGVKRVASRMSFLAHAGQFFDFEDVHVQCGGACGTKQGVVLGWRGIGPWSYPPATIEVGDGSLEAGG